MPQQKKKKSIRDTLQEGADQQDLKEINRELANRTKGGEPGGRWSHLSYRELQAKAGKLAKKIRRSRS